MALHILIKVALECQELQVAEGKNVRTAIVKKTRIVTDNDRCDIGEGVEVGLHPSNVNDIYETKTNNR